MKRRFVSSVLILLLIFVFFSCATDSAAAEDSVDELPAVSAEYSADEAAVSGAAGQLPAASGPGTGSEPADADVTASHEPQLPAEDDAHVQDEAYPPAEDAAGASYEDEAVSPADEARDGELPEDAEQAPAFDAAPEDDASEAFHELPEEDEFVVYEVPIPYFIDVEHYYDGFDITDDDFLAVEEPAEEDDVPAETEQYDVPSPETAASDPAAEGDAVESSAIEPVFEFPEVTEYAVYEEESEPLSEMELMTQVPPREELKKPVVIIPEPVQAGTIIITEEPDIIVSEDVIPEEEEVPYEPAFSRSVTVGTNTILEVPYQGNWWVFLGDELYSGSISFQGRDFRGGKTYFSFRAVAPGRSLLHFFKQDIIAGVNVEDYLEVYVTKTDEGTVMRTLDEFIISQMPAAAGNDGYQSEEDLYTLPDSASFEPQTEASVLEDDSITYVPYEEELQAEWSAPSEAATTAGVTASVETVKPASSLIISEEPEVVDSLQLLSDYELFQRGKELEASGPGCDIEGALEAYTLLVSKYPASPYWQEATRRITYINRFYFFKR